MVFIHTRHGKGCGRVRAGVSVVARGWWLGAEEAVEEGREGGEVDGYQADVYFNYSPYCRTIVVVCDCGCLVSGWSHGEEEVVGGFLTGKAAGVFMAKLTQRVHTGSTRSAVREERLAVHPRE